MRKFRIIRGDPKRGKGIGTTVEGKTLEDAMRAEHREAHNFSPAYQALVGTIKPNPVIAVFELTRVPEQEWKKYANL